jgi:Swt1-like HEPN
MIAESDIELFVLKSAVIKAELDNALERSGNDEPLEPKSTISPLFAQVSGDIRANAEKMAEYYKVFYMLENDIRSFIDATLTAAHGSDWWSVCAPESVKTECEANRKRELDSGVTARSESPLDYVTFGQLGEIIRKNYPQFGGVLSSEAASSRVMYSLNLLRGPIAHCGILAEDEVARLKLAVTDGFDY